MRLKKNLLKYICCTLRAEPFGDVNQSDPGILNRCFQVMGMFCRRQSQLNVTLNIILNIRIQKCFE